MREITLVANMMMRPSDMPYLEAVIPALHSMCNRIVLMYNGPHYDYYEQVAEMLNEEDTLIKNFQRDIDYGAYRDIMLQHVNVGEWVLKWDPDELPTAAACLVKDLISDELQKKYTTIGVPIYHLVKDNRALAIEFGYSHMRIFKKQPATQWAGKVHEQIRNPGAVYILPKKYGMGVIHFSYYSPERLRRKEKHYATVPGSGHGPGSLFKNIKAGLRDLPPNMVFSTPDGWLEKIKELT